MLDFIGTVVIAAVTFVNVNAVISTWPVQQAARLMLAAAAGTWVGVSAATAATGLLTAARPFPVVGLFVAAPLVAALLATASQSSRVVLLGTPLPLLVGLNVSRVFGAFFLLLAADGRLSGPLPYFAGWGDVATGVLAVPLAWYAARRRAQSAGMIAAWNVFGAADLIVAVTLGVTSAADSPLQVFHGGAGSAAIQVLPWALVPTVLVPFYLVVHGVIWAQLRAQKSQRIPVPAGTEVAGRAV
jgi:hypothetical protein